MDVSTRLYQIRRTCCEMLADRGYLVAEVSTVISVCDRVMVCVVCARLCLCPCPHTRTQHADTTRHTYAHNKKNTPKELKSMSHADFRVRYGDVPSKSELTLLCQRLDDPTKRIFVFFPEASKVGVKEIKDILARMKEEAVDRAVMVAGANLTPFARSIVAEIAGKQTIEVMMMMMMMRERMDGARALGAQNDSFSPPPPPPP
jgi:hypothetical protein